MKAQFRFTAQKLGLEQAKHNSQAIITRADIATLAQQRNILLAREKAEKLIQDETMNNILEAVEMEIGVILKIFHELEQGITPSPVLVEAASTIIYAAPCINSKELDGIRNFLSQRLGPEFTRSVTSNRAGYVSQRLLKAMSSPVPSAYHLDYVLHETTKSHGIPWSPDPPPRDFVVNSLSECLDIAAAPEVDLPRLRNLCLRGLPDKPAWLRPRVWKILFGLVSPKKSAWTSELANQRDAYYDFVRRLLQPFLQPAAHLPTRDEKLFEAYKELSGLPRAMFLLLEEEPEMHSRCPLSDDAPEDIRISYARILESRLKQIIEPEEEQQGSLTPEIRLEPEPELSTTPGISLTTFDSGLPEGVTTPRTLLASRKCMFGNMHAGHCSALLRLLYLHNAINPANSSSHAASILVPLYSAMLQEVEIEDLTHVEADTFWLLESIVAELSEVDEDGGQRWMAKLAQRLAWADYDLFTELQSQGLDPALPHYSYRWLTTILAHTLPLSDLFLAWDALFSREPRKKGLNPKLDYLVNICTAMILRGKTRLRRIWRTTRGGRSLWTGDVDLPPLRNNPHDTFLESLTFLQIFDPKYIGGIERVLQTAADLIQRHHQLSVGAQQSTSSLTSRFNFWKNSAEQVPKEVPRKSSTLGVAETPDASWQSQIASTVWRGITNQTAMDDVPPSPNTEVDSLIDMHSQSAPAASPASPSLVSSDIWGYAEKIKDSDALARLSKVGTNWKAMTMLSSWGNASTSSDAMHSSPSPSSVSKGSFQGSLSSPSPESSRLLSSPPPKSHPTPQSPQGNGGVAEKTRYFFTTRSSVSPTPKSPPKPLLLISQSRITSSHIIRSSIDQQLHSAPTPESGEKDEWAEVMKSKHFHRDSQSSVSSLSPSDAFARVTKSARSDWDSDTASSRIVPLNRRSVSPMAPHYRRPSSRVSSTSSASDLHSPPTKAKSPLQESSSIDAVVELGRGKSSSAPTKSDPLSDPDSSDTTSYQTNAPSKRTPFSKDIVEVKKEEDSRTGHPARSVRVRTRRYPRPPNLHIHDMLHSEPAIEEKSTDPSKNLAVEWPIDSQENTITPRASSFGSDEHVSAPGVVRSPRRLKASGDPERTRKVSTDNANEERSRKLSSRSRRVSMENREASRSRRESAAEEGDDEGYDELLSAYESEDATNETTRN